MKKTACAALAAGLILFVFSACGTAPAAVTPPPTPEPVVQTPPPAALEGRYGFDVLPVTEEDIKAFYAKEGYYTVQKVTPYEGDFLVTVGYGAGEENSGLLYWIFGATGRQVQLNGMCDVLDVKINGRGDVTVTDSGVSWSVPWKGLPGTYHYRVIGDENGVVDTSYAECFESRDTTWLDPAEPLYIGWWDGDGTASSGRNEQVYDARMDVDGLSFSFIPQGGSSEGVGNFITASTTTPSFDTSYDKATSLFTLRLHNVSLRSGEKGEEYEGVSYPYEFPAGSLGKDSRFITDAQIKAVGADAVVTFHLTDAAYRFTVESGNLGYDNIPMFRLVFREYNNDLD